tara:strand:- start:286 stop:717 length:432 start_codon:yes stop_codon:yes gene_type:complete
MEIQQLLNSALTKTNEYINLTKSKETYFKNEIETKNNLVSTQSELIDKLRNEMSDFLKVSFASKWMNEAERLKKKNEELTTTNKSLNQTLDNLTNSQNSKPKMYDKDTQTDNIYIKTKKTTYVLKENELYNENNKSIGIVCSN